MKTFDEYRGISYRKASKLATALLVNAVDTGSWFEIPERLICLRGIMERHKIIECSNQPIDGTGWAEAAFEPMSNDELSSWARREGGPKQPSWNELNYVRRVNGEWVNDAPK